MTKRVIRRLFETFFRRWYLYILPLVLFIGAGVAQASSGTSGYRSGGVMSVAQDTVLSQLTQIRGEGFGYETPAAATSSDMNSLLGTERFLDAVIERAQITDALQSGLITELGVRQSIFATPGGDQLVQVVATTEFPDLSQRLASATIESFIAFEIEEKVSQSAAAEDFFDNQIRGYQREADDAQRELDRFVSSVDAARLEDQTLEEQIGVQQRQADVTAAETRLASAQEQSEAARLEREKTESDVRQQLRVVDEPQVPSAPESRRKDMIMTVAMFTFVGLLLTTGLVALAVVADRTFRVPEDVEHALGVKVVAVVPDIAA